MFYTKCCIIYKSEKWYFFNSIKCSTCLVNIYDQYEPEINYAILFNFYDGKIITCIREL